MNFLMNRMAVVLGPCGEINVCLLHYGSYLDPRDSFYAFNECMRAFLVPPE